ncbi:MAG: metallophosphoesterase [Pseudomonadota bacterium]
MVERRDNPRLGAHLFRFAVISDTHVNPADDHCNSPFPVNARANRRFRHLVGELNQRDLDFVLHLGDLVHPIPASGDLYARAAQAYRAIIAELKVPIHVIPGNHDIGDKPGAGGPVPSTSMADIASWESEFGAHYTSFETGGMRFVLLNAQLINSGLPQEALQKDWADALLATGQRSVVALHHPPFICTADEPDHYDNLQQPGRDWVLELAARPGVELTLSGHAHNFWYDRVGKAEYYRLPAISFVRQDYSEMLRAAPGSETEFGRDDTAKLGYMIIDVFEKGHATQIVRTYGAERGIGEVSAAPKPLAPSPRISRPLIGFDLRQNWAELTEIAPSGALDEFDRKTARNDYPLMGLIEMGVQRIRLPLADLRDPLRRDRLDALVGLGFRPTLFCLGFPHDDGLSEIRRHAFDSIEVALPREHIPELTSLPQVDLPVFISPIHAHTQAENGIRKHTIEHGFEVTDTAILEHLSNLRDHGAAGFVVREFAGSVTVKWWQDVRALREKTDLSLSLHLRTGGPDPARETEDCSATLCALDILAQDVPEKTSIFVDTLITQDRGYFPRPGALCPAHNPSEISAAVARANSSKG